MSENKAFRGRPRGRGLSRGSDGGRGGFSTRGKYAKDEGSGGPKGPARSSSPEATRGGWGRGRGRGKAADDSPSLVTTPVPGTSATSVVLTTAVSPNCYSPIPAMHAAIALVWLQLSSIVGFVSEKSLGITAGKYCRYCADAAGALVGCGQCGQRAVCSAKEGVQLCIACRANTAAPLWTNGTSICGMHAAVPSSTIEPLGIEDVWNMAPVRLSKEKCAIAARLGLKPGDYEEGVCSNQHALMAAVRLRLERSLAEALLAGVRANRRVAVVGCTRFKRVGPMPTLTTFDRPLNPVNVGRRRATDSRPFAEFGEWLNVSNSGDLVIVGDCVHEMEAAWFAEIARRGVTVRAVYMVSPQEGGAVYYPVLSHPSATDWKFMEAVAYTKNDLTTTVVDGNAHAYAHPPVPKNFVPVGAMMGGMACGIWSARAVPVTETPFVGSFAGNATQNGICVPLGLTTVMGLDRNVLCVPSMLVAGCGATTGKDAAVRNVEGVLATLFTSANAVPSALRPTAIINGTMTISTAAALVHAALTPRATATETATLSWLRNSDATQRWVASKMVHVIGWFWIMAAMFLGLFNYVAATGFLIGGVQTTRVTIFTALVPLIYDLIFTGLQIDYLTFNLPVFNGISLTVPRSEWCLSTLATWAWLILSLSGRARLGQKRYNLFIVLWNALVLTNVFLRYFNDYDVVLQLTKTVVVKVWDPIIAGHLLRDWVSWTAYELHGLVTNLPQTLGFTGEFLSWCLVPVAARFTHLETLMVRPTCGDVFNVSNINTKLHLCSTSGWSYEDAGIASYSTATYTTALHVAYTQKEYYMTHLLSQYVQWFWLKMGLVLTQRMIVLVRYTYAIAQFCAPATLMWVEMITTHAGLYGKLWVFFGWFGSRVLAEFMRESWNDWNVYLSLKTTEAARPFNHWTLVWERGEYRIFLLLLNPIMFVMTTLFLAKLLAWYLIYLCACLVKCALVTPLYVLKMTGLFWPFGSGELSVPTFRWYRAVSAWRITAREVHEGLLIRCILTVAITLLCLDRWYELVKRHLVIQLAPEVVESQTVEVTAVMLRSWWRVLPLLALSVTALLGGAISFIATRNFHRSIFMPKFNSGIRAGEYSNVIGGHERSLRIQRDIISKFESRKGKLKVGGFSLIRLKEGFAGVWYSAEAVTKAILVRNIMITAGIDTRVEQFGRFVDGLVLGARERIDRKGGTTYVNEFLADHAARFTGVKRDNYTVLAALAKFGGFGQYYLTGRDAQMKLNSAHLTGFTKLEFGKNKAGLTDMAAEILAGSAGRLALMNGTDKPRVVCFPTVDNTMHTNELAVIYATHAACKAVFEELNTTTVARMTFDQALDESAAMLEERVSRLEPVSTEEFSIFETHCLTEYVAMGHNPEAKQTHFITSTFCSKMVTVTHNNAGDYCLALIIPFDRLVARACTMTGFEGLRSFEYFNHKLGELLKINQCCAFSVHYLQSLQALNRRITNRTRNCVLTHDYTEAYANEGVYKIAPITAAITCLTLGCDQGALWVELEGFRKLTEEVAIDWQTDAEFNTQSPVDVIVLDEHRFPILARLMKPGFAGHEWQRDPVVDLKQEALAYLAARARNEEVPALERVMKQVDQGQHPSVAVFSPTAMLKGSEIVERPDRGKSKNIITAAFLARAMHMMPSEPTVIVLLGAGRPMMVAEIAANAPAWKIIVVEEHAYNAVTYGWVTSDGSPPPGLMAGKIRRGGRNLTYSRYCTHPSDADVYHFTPAEAARSMRALVDELQGRGYQRAVVFSDVQFAPGSSVDLPVQQRVVEHNNFLRVYDSILSNLRCTWLCKLSGAGISAALMMRVNTIIGIENLDLTTVAPVYVTSVGHARTLISTHVQAEFGGDIYVLAQEVPYLAEPHTRDDGVFTLRTAFGIVRERLPPFETICPLSSEWQGAAATLIRRDPVSHFQEIEEVLTAFGANAWLGHRAIEIDAAACDGSHGPALANLQRELFRLVQHFLPALDEATFQRVVTTPLQVLGGEARLANNSSSALFSGMPWTTLSNTLRFVYIARVASRLAGIETAGTSRYLALNTGDDSLFVTRLRPGLRLFARPGLAA